MKIRDRIKELRRVKASELLPNPKNWRTHPQHQRDALKGVLAEVGYADALLARETPDGLMLIDGHLRAETTPDQEVPVLVLDVDEREADYLLATHDPLAALAEASGEALDALISGINTHSASVQDMLYGLLPLDVVAPEEPAGAGGRTTNNLGSVGGDADWVLLRFGEIQVSLPRRLYERFSGIVEAGIAAGADERGAVEAVLEKGLVE